MGAQQSTPGENQLLSSEEIFQFKALLNTIDGHDGHSPCTTKDFEKYCEQTLDHELSTKLAKKFSVKNPDGEGLLICHSSFLEFFGKLFKGTVEEKIECAFGLASSGSEEECLSREQILSYCESLVRSYIRSAEKTRRSQSWKGCTEMTDETVTQLAEFLLSPVLYPGLEPKEIFSAEPEKLVIGLNDLIDRLSLSPLFLDLQSSVFSHCFSFEEKEYLVRLIPHCLKAKKCLLPEPFTLLDIPRILFLNSQVRSELRREWRYLFTTAADGESFSHMMAAMKHQGATLIVVKDTEGRIFGGFADECWAVGPKFHGTKESFLFHLHPKMLAYSSTGFNENYQYLNIQQQTMPNGLGMGGQLEYFALWIDAEFGKGKCAPSCTTFDAPQLSATEEFTIEELEVWGVGPLPTNEEELREPQDAKSVLDVDPQGRAVLELVNKPLVSDGYRTIAKSYEEVINED